MKNINRIFIVLFLILFPNIICAQTFQQLLSSAKKGNIEAQIKVGECYFKGTEVIQDLREAEKWFQMAAEKNNKIAKFYIGAIYEEREMFAEAINWYKAVLEPGFTFTPGKNLKKKSDYGIDEIASVLIPILKESADLLKKASSQGIVVSDYLLGNRYKYGVDGLKQSVDDALKCYKKAAERGFEPAMVAIGNIYQTPRYYKALNFQKPNTEESIMWYKKASDRGSVYGSNSLGLHYYGKDVIKDAIYYFMRAADLNYGDAQFYLGKIYFNEKDFGKAAEFYRKALENGKDDAKFYYEEAQDSIRAASKRTTANNKKWPQDYCQDTPSVFHDNHPLSAHISGKYILWAMDGGVDDKDYTMYYTKETSNYKSNAVTDVFFVPTDYKPVVENGKEITCPPRVQYFTFHPNDNLIGARVEEIVRKSDGHLYKIEKELIFDEVFGDRVFFFLTGETKYDPDTRFSPKNHKINSSTPMKTVTTKIR